MEKTPTKKIQDKKTKILAIGDIHGDKGLAKKLAERAKKENVDLVIIAGDLTFFENSIENLIGPFIKANKEVLLIPGNHESKETIQILEDLYPNTIILKNRRRFFLQWLRVIMKLFLKKFLLNQE